MSGETSAPLTGVVSLTEVLLAHAWDDWNGHCSCGWYVPRDLRGDDIDLAHAAHQAQAVAPLVTAARADERERVLLDAADEMEAVIADGDVAEVAAPVVGEIGRPACVQARDALYQEPHEWLREYARAVLTAGADQ